MANEIKINLSVKVTDGIVTETIGDGNTTYSLDQSHAAMRRFTKYVRGLPIVRSYQNIGQYGFGIGNTLNMAEEREKELNGEAASDTYKYNYLDFGEDIFKPNVVTFYNLADDYPIWICTLFRTTDNDNYTVLPFLEIPPKQTVGPTKYPLIANNYCDKIQETPMWFAMVGLPKNYSGNRTSVRRTLYMVVYDS